LATCERATAAAQHVGGGPRAAAAGFLRRKGAAHAGEDTTVHGRDRGGSKDERGAVATELGGGVHGGRALARAHSTESEREHIWRADGVRASVLGFGAYFRRAQGRDREVGACVSHGRA